MSNRQFVPKEIFDLSKITNYNVEFVSVGHRKCVPGFSCWTVQGPSHYIIHYNLSGKVKFIYDNKEVILKENDIFVFFPGKAYRFIADNLNPLDYVWLSLKGDGADAIMSNTFFNADKPYGHFSKDLSPLFFEIMKIERNKENIIEKYIKLYKLLSVITDPEKHIDANNVYHSEKGTNDHFIGALDYIEKNYHRNFKITELADHLFISRDYLFKLFIKNTGTSPSNFITQYRLNEAMQLLSNISLSLNEIAHQTGFYDAYHFSRTFKKHQHKSPTQYRKELLDIISK